MDRREFQMRLDGIVAAAMQSPKLTLGSILEVVEQEIEAIRGEIMTAKLREQENEHEQRAIAEAMKSNDGWQ